MNSDVIMVYLETVQDKHLRVDTPIQLTFSVGSDTLNIHFNVQKSLVSQREDISDISPQFDMANPVHIPIADIQDELNSIFAKALELRSQQIEGTTTVKTAPDYRGFFNALPTLRIFRLAQSQSRADVDFNGCYTDFSSALNASMAGAENPVMLQAALEDVLKRLVFPEGEDCLTALHTAIDLYNIPIVLEEFQKKSEIKK